MSAYQSVTLGTRGSKLALAQTATVASGLRAVFPDITVHVHTKDPLGDRDKTTALYELNDKNLWTGELEELLAAGTVDAIVHSLKDMPTSLPDGMKLGAILKRASPQDALILKAGVSASGKSAHAILSALPAGSIIGTSSLRRTAQLRRAYPQLSFAICRGNLGTRISKLDTPGKWDDCPDFAALVLAAAGLERIGLGDRISALLEGSVEGGSCLYAVGQGAIGVEIREGDERAEKLIASLNHQSTAWACKAERSLMRTLEGGCSVPIGVESVWKDGGKTLELRGIVVSIEGDEAVEAIEHLSVADDEIAEELGRRVAKALVEKGAGRILDVINEEKRKTQEEARRKVGDDVKAYVEKTAAGASA